jgi:hypothetical protein
MEDIIASLMHTLYIWTMAYLAPLSITFADFLICFSFSS